MAKPIPIFQLLIGPTPMGLSKISFVAATQILSVKVSPSFIPSSILSVVGSSP